MTRTSTSPLTIEEFVIITLPDDSNAAVSPDGLLLDQRLGIEIKTKDYRPVPRKPTDVLHCEYLQCQMSLFAASNMVDNWLLCCHRLDTNEISCMLIRFDETLWTTWLSPAINEFTQRVQHTAQALLDRVSREDVDFYQFMEEYKYGRMNSKQKKELVDYLLRSKTDHITPVRIEY